jgi:hypothetical protein
MSENTQQLVMLDLFSRGTAVPSLLRDAAPVVEKYKTQGTGKDRTFVLNKQGQKIVTTRTIKILPLKSKENDDLADLFQQSGSALKASASDVNRGLLKAGSAHFNALIASGNYTHKLSRINERNGEFTITIKPEIGKVALLGPEELAKQAAALGYTLTPKEEPKKALTEGDGEDEPSQANGAATVVVDAKAAKKAAKASKAAKAAELA